MMARKPTKPPGGEYVVGKGRPPIATRWKPGQSGNPKGRPKGSKSLQAFISEVLSQKVSITERGKMRLAFPNEIIAKQIVGKAMNGDPKSILTMFNVEPKIAHQELVRTSEPRSTEDLIKLYQKLIKQPY